MTSKQKRDDKPKSRDSLTQSIVVVVAIVVVHVAIVDIDVEGIAGILSSLIADSHDCFPLYWQKAPIQG